LISRRVFRYSQNFERINSIKLEMSSGILACVVALSHKQMVNAASAVDAVAKCAKAGARRGIKPGPAKRRQTV
jgi:hypothetical protein